jgi:hypothetical protein
MAGMLLLRTDPKRVMSEDPWPALRMNGRRFRGVEDLWIRSGKAPVNVGEGAAPVTSPPSTLLGDAGTDWPTPHEESREAKTPTAPP